MATTPAPFPVGKTVLREHKATDGKALALRPGKWTPVDAITLPAGGIYECCTQVRIPAGYWCLSRLVRVGWGDDGKLDETGHHPFRPVPGGAAFSDGHSHTITGGGPLRWELCLMGPGSKPVKVPTIICKAKRIV